MKSFIALLIAGSLVACDSAPQRENVASRSSGAVDAVTSGDPTKPPSNAVIAEDVRQSIVADPTLSPDAKKIEIVAEGGVVTLRGQVRSIAEKENVDSRADHVEGVRRVENEVDIVE